LTIQKSEYILQESLKIKDGVHMSEIKVVSKIELWPPDRLLPYDRNPRVHSQEQIEAIKNSIRRYGFNAPVRVHRELGITAGHGTFQAARELGLKKIPVVCLDHLSKQDAKGFVLADNKSYEMGGWDDKLTAELLADLSGAGFCMEDTLFAGKEIDKLLKRLDRALPAEEIHEDAPDEAPPGLDAQEKKWKVKVGQVWELGRHRIMCGDCTDRENIKRVLGDVRPMVVTDPPFGIGIQNADGHMGGKDQPHSQTGKTIPQKFYPAFIGDNNTDVAKLFLTACIELDFLKMIVWGGNYFTDILPPSQGWIIWDKRPDGSQNNFADCEMAWTSFDCATKIHRQLWDGFRRQGEKINRTHPTQKPIELMLYCLSYADGEENIFDGFLGSGTTLMACERKNKKCFGFELHPEFFGRILERWFAETNIKPKLLKGV
jgi:hypothetical protein